MGQSIARMTAVVGVILLLGVSLAFYEVSATTATGARNAPTVSSSTAGPPSLTSMRTLVTLALTSPEEGEMLISGESYTISGLVPQSATLPDTVLIQVSQQDSLTFLVSGYAGVQPDGSFSYSTAVGMTWPSGTYVITATDSYGATGDLSVTVTYGDVWCC